VETLSRRAENMTATKLILATYITGTKTRRTGIRTADPIHKYRFQSISFKERLMKIESNNAELILSIGMTKSSRLPYQLS